MRYLNLLDYSIIAIYLSILVVLGIFLKKLASRSLDDYFSLAFIFPLINPGHLKGVDFEQGGGLFSPNLFFAVINCSIR